MCSFILTPAEVSRLSPKTAPHAASRGDESIHFQPYFHLSPCTGFLFWMTWLKHWFDLICSVLLLLCVEYVCLAVVSMELGSRTMNCCMCGPRCVFSHLMLGWCASKLKQTLKISFRVCKSLHKTSCTSGSRGNMRIVMEYAHCMIFHSCLCAGIGRTVKALICLQLTVLWSTFLIFYKIFIEGHFVGLPNMDTAGLKFLIN